FFFSSRRRHTRCLSDWSSDVCSSDLEIMEPASAPPATARTSSQTTEPVSAPAARVAASSGDGDISTERLRDYVGAFVLAGLDPRSEERRVGKECGWRGWGGGWRVRVK